MLLLMLRRLLSGIAGTEETGLKSFVRYSVVFTKETSIASQSRREVERGKEKDEIERDSSRGKTRKPFLNPLNYM